MRKPFIAMTIAAALTGGVTASSAAAAPARTLTAHVVATPARWVGAATSEVAAYRVGATVRTRSDDGAAHTIPAPAGCDVTTAGGGLLAGQCGAMTPRDLSSGTLHLGVWRLDGSEVTRFDVLSAEDIANGYGTSPPLEVGAEWIGLADSAKTGSWTEYVNWRTHEVRQDYGTDAGTVADPDRPGLGAALCAPVTRAVLRGPQDRRIHYGATVRRPYVLLDTRAGAVLRRCGAREPVALPEGFGPTALGYGWVAGWAGRRLEVVRLPDLRRYRVSGVTPGSRTAFTRGRLYTYPDAGVGAVRTVALPER